ncbi:MAG: sigma-70 family RNA polymerase sigma factor [Nitrospira sp.]|nr:sigma-70 family RNA polymerase sigma factor [Nitrospira sp.]MBH0183230.1 sigma-70 family RNA polymerase sigma factor [Nitrospira sp.]MBH0186104.1 sigma-70 family RNA polymerase sigma factor [Nitrospira sp.]
MPLDQPDEPSDAQLVARSLAQDHDAFGQLIDRHAAVIVNLAYRMVGNRAEAEDLAQETFLAAYKALSTFRADSKFSTWLYRIASNKCKDWLRMKRPGQGQYDLDADESLDLYVTEDRTPELLLSQQQVAQELEEAIQRLPPLYREAFVLKHIEGLSYEEMEEILGVRSDTLKMRVYKGRVQLSRELAMLNSIR